MGGLRLPRRTPRWKTSASAPCWTGITTWTVSASASRRSSPSPLLCRRYPKAGLVGSLRCRGPCIQARDFCLRGKAVAYYPGRCLRGKTCRTYITIAAAAKRPARALNVGDAFEADSPAGVGGGGGICDYGFSKKCKVKVMMNALLRRWFLRSQVDNPCPLVKHPEWLRKIVREINDGFHQTKIDQLFKAAPAPAAKVCRVLARSGAMAVHTMSDTRCQYTMMCHVVPWCSSSSARSVRFATDRRMNSRAESCFGYSYAVLAHRTAYVGSRTYGSHSRSAAHISEKTQTSNPS